MSRKADFNNSTFHFNNRDAVEVIHLRKAAIKEKI